MTGTEQETELRVSRHFDAPRDRVFDAWTNPEVLRQWWAAGPDWSTPTADVDVRPGGRYRLSMRQPDGVVHTAVGEYREVKPPERLVYTWTWEGGTPEMEGSQDTLVVVEFIEEGDGTEVVLTHTGFADEAIRDEHVKGWTALLANSERVFA
jgi:uncharacterized protein YndB with AHSA1/START domain